MSESERIPDWYGARSVCRHPKLEVDARHVYEERIVLIRAPSEEEAIRAAEDEAREYAELVDGEWVNDFVQTYLLDEGEVDDRGEVWSLMRASALDGPEYIRRFFWTGDEFARS